MDLSGLDDAIKKKSRFKRRGGYYLSMKVHTVIQKFGLC